jgi:hypothetical protein
MYQIQIQNVQSIFLLCPEKIFTADRGGAEIDGSTVMWSGLPFFQLFLPSVFLARPVGEVLKLFLLSNRVLQTR